MDRILKRAVNAVAISIFGKYKSVKNILFFSFVRFFSYNVCIDILYLLATANGWQIIMFIYLANNVDIYIYLNNDMVTWLTQCSGYGPRPL